MGFLSGKPQKSESRNKAYGWALQNFGGYATPAAGAMNAYASILGLPGTRLYGVDDENDGIPDNKGGGNPFGGTPPSAIGGAGGAAGGAGGAAGGNALGGLQGYFNSSGGNFLLNQGLDGLTNKFAALGLNRSGAAMKAMEQFRQDLVSTKLDNYLGHLNEVARLGLGAGGLVTNAGQYSKGTGATQGAGGLIGAGLAAIPFLSERSAKTDIVEDGPWDDRGDGLMAYMFRYKNDETRAVYRGVMADEVERLRPKALGHRLPNGMRTVNYALLGVA